MRTGLIAAAMICATGALSAQEYEVTLYLQPDRTGNNTLNKSVELDLEDGEITIEESGETANRYEDRDVTEGEAAAVIAFVETGIAGLDLSLGEQPDYPRVEVQVEIDTGTTIIEIESHYPAGAVPGDVLDFQRAFFEDIFE